MTDKSVKWFVAGNVILGGLFVIGIFGQTFRHLFSASTSALSGAAYEDEDAKSVRAYAPRPVAAPAAPSMRKEESRRAGAKSKALKDFGNVIGDDEAPSADFDGALAGAGGVRLAEASGKGGESSVEAPRTRAWFPETFLFEPRLVTDADGAASVSLTVPDRLTTWRILALAHSREGAQAGATTSFLGTLDTYVDPVVPPMLHAGDIVRLPIQLVNTTDLPVSKGLKLAAVGAKLSGSGGAVKLAAQSSSVEWVTVTADQPGKLTLEATLEGADRVTREVPILPTGKPFHDRHAGSLAAPRELTLELPTDLDPKTSRARLLVYPGALSLLRSELGASGARGGVAEDAYALRLAGDASKLLLELGDDPDPERLRTMSLLSTQRVLRDARANDPATAVLLLEAALAHPDSPVLQRLSERLVNTVVASQRPDGTCGGGPGWTLQRVLAATADCVRVVNAAATDDEGRRRAAGVSIKASGAVERHLNLVQDPYTAAALVASGAADGSIIEILRERIRAAAHANPDGSRSITTEDDVRRADAWPPRTAEVDALAILALDPVKDAALRADLGASLLSVYSPAYGWGDGRTNLTALRAAIALFKGGLPDAIKIELLVDGRPLADGTLAPKAKDPIALEAPIDARGKHVWSLRATPAVAGLAYAFEVAGYRPWSTEAMQGGLELSLTLSKDLTVGAPATVTVEAASPSGMALTLSQALPAGVQADRASLEALVATGTITSFALPDGEITLELPARDVGETFSATYRVIPTLAGTLHAGASTLAVQGRVDNAHHVAPVVWVVK